MSLFEPANAQRLDQDVVEQAMLWMVTLQSGVCSEAEHQACYNWRKQSPAHEMAWQRLTGLNRDVRESTHLLAPEGARSLLRARNTTSRRTLLKGFAGLGLVMAAGVGVRERVLLPELFSDYRTATGERRRIYLADGVGLTLDTHTALDTQATATGIDLTLNLGRVLLTCAVPAHITLNTIHGRVQPTTPARLIVSQGLPDLPGTQVQMLAGSASLELTRGGRISLEAGQQLTVDSHGAGQSSQVTAASQAWLNGLLIADRMPLAHVIGQLNRYRRGVLRCDPAVAALQVSGSFSIDQPDASLDLLARVLPIRVQRVFGYWANVVPA
ncbi:DUF4880 domain-containing protein [Pseudomonas sp. CCC3.1]|uniref:DUF4880 domain-containing protein n=1 Tax=Pseudomonas sp. CCC3.1 TaxID=3048607 RepID=UPI002AC988CA|nr:DUF4880 domain-containing protein [Pseudomonas sp. CCC3.1]MEB0207226.1 DUF4880 domain-containing protein [Pseudomonas sp. CCC3.1]WPX34430.1 DUF4880 domain-containing protein [Pseudomonas sp. CCC3.1]